MGLIVKKRYYKIRKSISKPLLDTFIFFIETDSYTLDDLHQKVNEIMDKRKKRRLPARNLSLYQVEKRLNQYEKLNLVKIESDNKSKIVNVNTSRILALSLPPQKASEEDITFQPAP